MFLGFPGAGTIYKVINFQDEYVKTLKKQYDDLEIVSQRMEEQYKTMDQSYRGEIKEIIKGKIRNFIEKISQKNFCFLNLTVRYFSKFLFQIFQKALDHQFDSRIFDWERKARELSEKEENFLEVKL